MITNDRLSGDLGALGVRSGQILLVHSSLSSIGYVLDGAQTVVSALRRLLAPDGVLVVPTGTPSDRSAWASDRSAGNGDRATVPPYAPYITPSVRMGRIAEYVRTTPGALRSAHPHTSFAALGPRAVEMIAGHAPYCLLGESSPLAHLYEAGASVLLLGVGYDRCTAFHLAEYRYTGRPPRRTYEAVVDFGQGWTWWQYVDVDLYAGDFVELGADFEKLHPVRYGRVGEAEARLFPLRAAVDFAVNWLKDHRPAAGR
jgi:aminoglycoside 3-N-acetyltransferase